MAQPPDIELEHDYDGIREYDNPLPRWWVWMFVGTVIWSLAYVPYYHAGGGKLPAEAHAQDMEAWFELHPPIVLPSDEELDAIAADDTQLARGKTIYATRCASCHAPDGGGLVGPNLTDDYAIHGFRMSEVVHTIFDGVPDKGMIPWKSQLKLEEIYAVAAYIRSLRGTTPANPKAPQGDPIVD